MTFSPKRPKTVAMIPARMESSRLPGKPMADICGMPMIEHVYRRCLLAKSLDAVYVATDSPEIGAAVERAGGRVLMTLPTHETGTDRIAEAADGVDCDIVVNVQGDEALLNPEHIDAVVQGLIDDPSSSATILVNPFRKYNCISHVKTVLDEQGYVMYFSRSDIPSAARTPNPELLKAYHIVPFRKPFLLEFASWPKGRLESIEFIEYMRILEKGRRIRAVRVDSSAISVDTPEDLEEVRAAMRADPHFQLYRRA